MPRARWGLRCLHEQVVVVADQAVRVTEPAEPCDHLVEPPEERQPVDVITDDPSATVSPRRYVIERAGLLNPKRTSHESSVERNNNETSELGEVEAELFDCKT